MTHLIRTSAVLALAALTGGAGCGSDDLFHLSSVAHGLSIREQAKTRIDGARSLVGEVTVAGDLDGDGYDDALIRDGNYQLPGEPDARGAVRVLYGGPALGDSLSLAALPGLIDDAPYGQASSVSSIAPVGDVDGDGLADLLVGDANYIGCYLRHDGMSLSDSTPPEDAEHGRAYLVYGSRTRLIGDTPLGSAGAELRDPLGCTDAGLTVSALGDLDHDGFADFAISSPEEDLRTDDVFLGLGHVYVFYGGPERLTGVHELGEAAAVLHAAAGTQSFGVAASAHGDLDGDGFDDVLLADAPYGGFVNSPAQGIGHAYVVRGGATRLTGTLDVSALAATTITGDLGGFQLAVLGDLDGDGADDFAVGAPYGYMRTNDRAAYHLFYGHRGGLPARLDTAAADAHLLSAQADWGMSPLVAADLDGDGKRDLVMGDANLGDARGGVYVRHGDGTRLGGDVELGAEGITYQGGTVQVPCPPSDPTVEHCTVQELAGAWVAVGDLDGDGRADVLASAPTNWGDGFASVYLLASRAQ
jgi:hypothetical protein